MALTPAQQLASQREQTGVNALVQQKEQQQVQSQQSQQEYEQAVANEQARVDRLNAIEQSAYNQAQSLLKKGRAVSYVSQSFSASYWRRHPELLEERKRVLYYLKEMTGGDLTKQNLSKKGTANTYDYYMEKYPTQAMQYEAAKEYNKARTEYNKSLLTPIVTQETPSQAIQSTQTSSSYSSVPTNVTYMKEPNWAMKFRSKYYGVLRDVGTFLGEGASGILSLGGTLDRKKEFNYGNLVGSTSPTGSSSTATYSFVAQTPEQRYYRGDITKEEYIKQATGAEYAGSFLKGAVLGGISVLAPPAALFLAGSSFAGVVANKEKVISQFKIAPVESSLNVVAGFGGAIVGGIGTSIAVSEIKSTFSTSGKEYVPAEQIISKDVLEGKKTFPEAPFGTSSSAKLRLKIFKNNKYNLPDETQQGVYHTSPYTFETTTKTVAGSSEVSGLYTAPSASSYFLKLDNPIENLKFFGLSQESVLAKSPSILRIYPKGISIAHLQKTGGSYPFLEVVGGKTGWAYVLNTKPEIEAVIPPNTPLVQTGARFYTTIEGTDVPIFQYGVGTTGTSAAEVLSTTGGYAPVTIFNPSTLSYAASSYGFTSIPSSISTIDVSSNYPLTSSKTPSTSYVPKPSYKPSVTYSYKPAPSYKPIYKPSYIAPPSYTLAPSYSPKPSYTPTPSYKPNPQYTPPYVPNQYENLIKKARKMLEGKAYKTYFFSKGKKQYLSGIAPRKEAILKGERKVLGTISARFGVEEVNVPMASSRYEPSAQVFRNYRIRGKGRIPLEDEWIQKAGTKREPTIKGARLASKSEVSDLLSFRKRKGRSLFK